MAEREHAMPSSAARTLGRSLRRCCTGAAPAIMRHPRTVPFRDGRVSFVRHHGCQGTGSLFQRALCSAPGSGPRIRTATIFTRAGLLKFTYEGLVLKVYKFAITKRHA